MRIGLLTDGGHPYATGESGLWCDRLVRGLPQHEFDLFAPSRSAHQEERGPVRLPHGVGRVRTVPLRAPEDGSPRGGGERGLLARLVTGGRGSYGRRERRRFTACLTALATAVCASGSATGASGPGTSGSGTSGSGTSGSGGSGTGTAVSGACREEPAAPTTAALFAHGLYGLAELAREHGGLTRALRSETTVRILESACRAPGTGRTVQSATVRDHLAFAAELERILRPLSLDRYGRESLGAVDVCHAASGGEVALPGLLGKRFFGVPLLVTEYSVPLRAHYLAAPDAPFSAPVHALLANFHRRLAAEVYRQAEIITPGSTDVRRWQERCGADSAKLRTVHPGTAADRFTDVGGSDDRGGPHTLVWVGRIEPAKDLISLLHAFAEVRRAEPGARLRIFGTPAEDTRSITYLAHCRALAARLFPGATGAPAEGDHPVSFEETGGPEAPGAAEAYAAGGVVVLSSAVEDFPSGLVEAMFCGRATVSTDVGAVAEVIGGTGLLVPPRNPRALADACVTLLRDPVRRARLGAAARARALELFTVEQNLAAFRGIYLELVSRSPVLREADELGADGGPRPFATPPEAQVPGRWTQPVPGVSLRAAEAGPEAEPGPGGVCTGVAKAACAAGAGAAGRGDGDA
ncbi:glycosyltransferase [Streptomyces sp. NPDC001787]|uniref:glycosyltransferase n=1 Tax=Streptomyces sp. NPDC001787 TaxID=3154523 RepID=UPI003321C1B0